MALNFTINDGFEDTPMPPELIAIVASFVYEATTCLMTSSAGSIQVCLPLLLPIAKGWPKTFELVRVGFRDGVLVYD